MGRAAAGAVADAELLVGLKETFKESSLNEPKGAAIDVHHFHRLEGIVNRLEVE